MVWTHTCINLIYSSGTANVSATRLLSLVNIKSGATMRNCIKYVWVIYAQMPYVWRCVFVCVIVFVCRMRVHILAAVAGEYQLGFVSLHASFITCVYNINICGALVRVDTFTHSCIHTQAYTYSSLGISYRHILGAEQRNCFCFSLLRKWIPLTRFWSTGLFSATSYIMWVCVACLCAFDKCVCIVS